MLNAAHVKFVKEPLKPRQRDRKWPRNLQRALVDLRPDLTRSIAHSSPLASIQRTLSHGNGLEKNTASYAICLNVESAVASG
jgi:hypothetical protein